MGKGWVMNTSHRLGIAFGALAGALDSGVGGPDPVGGGLSGLLASGTDHKPGTLRGGLYTDGQCRIVAGAA